MAQNSQIGMSRCLDASSTSQMAQIMGKIEDPVGTSRTKLVRSSICRIAVGETIRRSFIGTWMGGNSELGMYVRSSKTRVLSVSICGRHQNVWKEAEYVSHVEEIDEKCGH